MDVRNCRGCGRLYNHMRGPQLCPACLEELEQKFQNLKEYLRLNPGAPMNELAEVNEVSVKQIRQWVREERLSFTEDSQIAIECELCGAKIYTGRFCAKCKNNLQNGLDNAIRKPTATLVEPKKNRDKDKMRFLDK